MPGAHKPDKREVQVIALREQEDEVVSEMVSRMEAEAYAETALGVVTLRWGREQIGLVKRAAALVGVPYQTYLKQVVYRQAIADIEKAQSLQKGPGSQ